MGVCSGQLKTQKSQKLSGVRPVLGDYEGLVVLRRACTLIIRVEVDDLQLRKSKSAPLAPNKQVRLQKVRF